jgi:hypothetical protein
VADDGEGAPAGGLRSGDGLFGRRHHGPTDSGGNDPSGYRRPFDRSASERHRIDGEPRRSWRPRRESAVNGRGESAVNGSSRRPWGERPAAEAASAETASESHARLDSRRQPPPGG